MWLWLIQHFTTWKSSQGLNDGPLWFPTSTHQRNWTGWPDQNEFTLQVQLRFFALIFTVFSKKNSPNVFWMNMTALIIRIFFFFFWRLCQGYRQTVSWRKGELSQVSAGERSSPSYLVNSIINTVIQLKPLGVSRNENWCSYSAQWASQVGPN